MPPLHFLVQPLFREDLEHLSVVLVGFLQLPLLVALSQSKSIIQDSTLTARYRNFKMTSTWPKVNNFRMIPPMAAKVTKWDMRPHHCFTDSLHLPRRP